MPVSETPGGPRATDEEAGRHREPKLTYHTAGERQPSLERERGGARVRTPTVCWIKREAEFPPIQCNPCRSSVVAL